MKKIFVVTDNKFIFTEFKKIIDVKDGVLVEYFCSPKSEHIFKDEVASKTIKPMF